MKQFWLRVNMQKVGILSYFTTFCYPPIMEFDTECPIKPNIRTSLTSFPILLCIRQRAVLALFHCYWNSKPPIERLRCFNIRAPHAILSLPVSFYWPIFSAIENHFCDSAPTLRRSSVVRMSLIYFPLHQTQLKPV